VDSEVGIGSTFCFTVTLPVANPAAFRDLQLQLARSDKNENKIDISPLRADASHMAVLVVDDHPINRMLLQQQLEQLGLQVKIAAYGIVALSLWWSEHFDIIITDCHMPEMDGYELTRSIREMEQHEGRSRVPIIAWTANVLAEEEKRCQAAGMDDLLTKPTELADLRMMLLKWLDQTELMPSIVSPPALEQQDPTADSVIDFSALNRISKSHIAQVEMLQEFEQYNRSDIAVLKAELKNSNPQAIAHSAHRIKGACRMVGAVELEALSARIEMAAKHDELDEVLATADKMLDEAVAKLEQAIIKFNGTESVG
jgi:CheY-like chemotaxis protein